MKVEDRESGLHSKTRKIYLEFGFQVECNVFLSQEKLRAFCKQMNIVVMAYTPLQGVRSPSPPVIQELMGKYKKSAAQIVLRYLVRKLMRCCVAVIFSRWLVVRDICSYLCVERRFNVE